MKLSCMFWVLVLLPWSITTLSQEWSGTIQDKKKGAQEKPHYLEPYHRNIIKFNPTPMLVLDLRNVTFAYERLLKHNQSIAVQAGYLVFNTAEDTIAGLINITDKTRNGINLAMDYRYYPFQRSKRPAPDGIYVGGYFQYYGFWAENKFDILGVDVDKDGKMTTQANFENLGIEIGYQFVFWERMTIDFILFGPSLNIHTGYLKIEGDLDEEQINKIDEEIIDKLIERYPSLGMIYSEESLTFTGQKTSFGMGFRYSIQIGFHF